LLVSGRSSDSALPIALTSTQKTHKIWNSIPLHIRQSQTHSSFRRHLKTYYFHSAYPDPIAAPVMRPDSLLRLWRYINPLLTYLLTQDSIILGLEQLTIIILYVYFRHLRGTPTVMIRILLLTVQLKVCCLTPPAQWSWRHLADKRLETFSKV